MRKSIIAALAMVVLSAGVAFSAQQQGGMNDQMGGGQMGGGQMRGRRGGMNIDAMVARMKSDLNLNDKQTSQVRELYEKQARDNQSWRKDHAQASPEEMRAHRGQMMADMNDGLKKILTPEQFKKHQDMMKEQMDRGRMGRGPEAPPQN